MYWAGPILGGIAAGLIYQLLLAVSDTISRPSNTGFGIWDLPQESSIKAKFGTSLEGLILRRDKFISFIFSHAVFARYYN